MSDPLSTSVFEVPTLYGGTLLLRREDGQRSRPLFALSWRRANGMLGGSMVGDEEALSDLLDAIAHLAEIVRRRGLPW